MLSYRHAFHAGNSGDVLKHALLVQMLKLMARKERGFLYFETHAGAGAYDLSSPEAQKVGEYRDGIARLLDRPAITPGVSDYLEAVAALNPEGGLQHYPGSPWLARHYCRAQDRLLLCELHGSEYPLLKRHCAGDRRCHVHHRDGLEALRAFLPAPEQRALIHIDPSYEVKSDYLSVVGAVREAHRRMRGAVIALWYPLLSNAMQNGMLEQLAESGVAPIARFELEVRPPGIGMYGSGVLVVNPPWGLMESGAAMLDELHGRLAQADAACRCDWLVEESAASR